MIDIGRLKSSSAVLVLCMFALVIIGAITVFSTTFTKEEPFSFLFYNQILFYGLGLLIFVLLSSVNYENLNKTMVFIIIFALTFILLVAVLIAGTSVGEAQRWIALGDFSIQPSELAKFAIVFTIAFGSSRLFKFYKEKATISQERVQKVSLDQVKKPSIFRAFLVKIKAHSLILIPCSVIIFFTFLQKSLGSTVLLAGVFFLTYFYILPVNFKFFLKAIFFIFSVTVSFIDLPLNIFGKEIFGIQIEKLVILLLVSFLFSILFKIRLKSLFLILLIALLVKPFFSFFYDNLLVDYQKTRFETFLTPGDNLNEEWNRKQSLTAIGSGRLSGLGLLNSPIINNRLLPFAFTDFSFAAFASQFGLIGVAIILGIYFFIFSTSLSSAKKSKNNFGKVLSFGSGIIIALNVVQHIGVNLGVLPITGVPLPLISYGGTAILTVFIALGIANSVFINNELYNENFEKFDLS